MLRRIPVIICIPNDLLWHWSHCSRVCRVIRLSVIYLAIAWTWSLSSLEVAGKFHFSFRRFGRVRRRTRSWSMRSKAFFVVKWLWYKLYRRIVGGIRFMIHRHSRGVCMHTVWPPPTAPPHVYWIIKKDIKNNRSSYVWVFLSLHFYTFQLVVYLFCPKKLRTSSAPKCGNYNCISLLPECQLRYLLVRHCRTRGV